MKRIISFIIIAILLCSLAFIPSSAASSKGVKEEYLNSDKWLTLSTNKTGPRYFVDTKGKPVELFGHHRCQSLAASEDIVYSTLRGYDALAEVYSKYGANFIRLAIDMPELCGGEKRTAKEINTFILNNVDNEVQTIIRQGMYVMLDIHMYPELPENATAEDSLKYARDYYLPVLKELAKKYKDEPMVAVYEIWNEPYPADKEQLTFEKSVWNKGVRQYFIDAVNEIRKIDTRHVILVSDWNAGWGTALPDTWKDYYDKVDPVYRNTAFSVHACKTELDEKFTYYKNWWKNLARDNNLCLIFGEIETVAGISSAKGIQNLCDMFTETKDEFHFSGALWGPHQKATGYFDIWADSGWIDGYCGSDPIPMARYTTEAEDVLNGKSAIAETVTDTLLFGSQDYGTGISIKPAAATVFQETTTEILSNIVYKAGKHKLMVRVAGKAGYTGDFILGYKDIGGVVHQIARFAGKNTNMQPYYQTVEFTAQKQIVSFVFFSCETKEKSVIIDRIYVTGPKSDDETVLRSKLKIPNTHQVIDLSGKKYTVNVKTPGSFEETVTGTDVKDKSSKLNSSKKEENSKNEASSNNVTIEVVEPAEDDSDDDFFSEMPKSTAASNDLTVYVIVVLGVLLILGVIIAVLFIISKSVKK